MTRRESPASSGDGQVRLRIADAVAHVLFDRPWARNAMTWAMYDGLAAACAVISCRPEREARGLHPACSDRARAAPCSSPRAVPKLLFFLACRVAVALLRSLRPMTFLRTNIGLKPEGKRLAFAENALREGSAIPGVKRYTVRFL
jgi:hypothetical protein